jgi:hypothetical protein
MWAELGYLFKSSLMVHIITTGFQWLDEERKERQRNMLLVGENLRVWRVKIAFCVNVQLQTFPEGHRKEEKFERSR